MKNCGKRFHSEVGKFRFLNELIKVVSPKVGRPTGLQGLQGAFSRRLLLMWLSVSVPGLPLTRAGEEEGSGVDLQLDGGVTG